MMSGTEHYMEIDNQSVFEQYLDSAARATRYAIDTEFHRERTYYPDLALIQMRFLDAEKTPRGALIDPKALDLSPLTGLFGSDALALMHAPTQDFDVFEHEVGCLPSRFFDTQVAAGFLGFSSASLASLAQRYAKVSLSKGDRLSDWNRRPLSVSQKRYAYSDVEHLEQITDVMVHELSNRNRLDWVDSAFRELLSARRPPLDPYEAWRSISEGRTLDQPRRGALIELAAWRELKARELNLPPRRICGDIVLVCIAQRLPEREADFLEVRGFTKGRLMDPAVLLPLISAGRRRPLPAAPPRNHSADQRAVALISAYVAALALEQEIDRALLATREDIEMYLTGSSTKLTSTWRTQLLGTTLDELADGTLALALAPSGGFRLVRA